MLTGSWDWQDVVVVFIFMYDPLNKTPSSNTLVGKDILPVKKKRT